MQLFGSNKNYLGVDPGTSSIKIVELQNRSEHAQLLTYGYVEQETDIIRASSAAMETKIIDIIKSVYKDSRMSSRKVNAALPSFSVFNSIISLPVMNKKDLAQAVRWEAKKFIPLPIDEMVLDWKIIPEVATNEKKHSLFEAKDKIKKEDLSESKLKETTILSKTDNDLEKNTEEDKTNGDKEEGANNFSSIKKLLAKKKSLGNSKKDGKNLKILLTAAPKKLVEKYIRIFKAADLELINLETESFALERSLAPNNFAPVMIIDIGSISSDVVIIDKGIPILTRSIDIGGVTLTKSIMTSLNVDLARAEQFKRDIGFSSAGPGDLPETVKTVINPIINEIKYCLDIYLSQVGNNNKTLEKIILTGGSAFLPDLTTYLSKLLDIKVIIGDPWDKIVYPLELKPVLQQLGPRFSVAIGLAMREI